MFKIFRNNTKPPAYEVPPAYNDTINIINTIDSQSDVCPSYKESASSFKDKDKDESSLIKQLGSNKYIVIDPKNYNLKNLVNQIVSNKHSNITLYTISNKFNTNYNITVDTDVIKVSNSCDVAILGLTTLQIKILDFVVSGDKYENITPQCDIVIDQNNNQRTVVYHHIAAFKNQ